MTKFRKRKRDLSGMTEQKRPGPSDKHGAHSKEIQKRYSDLRTKQGQRLAAVTKGLIADLGGEAQISTSQRVIISNVQSKLIVIFQISDWADKQQTLINKDSAELLPALGRSFLGYTDSLKRDLEALQKLGNDKKLPSDLYEKWRKEFFKDAIVSEKETKK